MTKIKTLIFIFFLSSVFSFTGCNNEEAIYPKVDPENNPEYELLATISGHGDERTDFFEVSSDEIVILYKVKASEGSHGTQNLEIFLGTGMEDNWDNPVIQVYNFNFGKGHHDEHAEEHEDTHGQEQGHGDEDAHGKENTMEGEGGHYAAGENIPAPQELSSHKIENPDKVGEKMFRFFTPDTYTLYIESTSVDYEIKVFQKILE